MRENFKLRKMKVGLVSVAITMLYIMTNGQAEASEGSQTVKNPKVNATEEIKAESQPVQNNQEVSSDQTKKNFVNLDPIKPGAQKVTGTTLPNQLILLSIDKKDVSSVDSEGSEFITSKDDGTFEYPLKNRKIVHNQEIEVTSSSMEGLEEEDEETEVEEQESNDATQKVTTPRYEKAYKIPEERLNKANGHHQVFIEPITEGSGIIKGHTSVKGKVALSINNKFINFEERAKDGISKEDTKASSDGIWMPINEKGYFDFDFKKNPFDNLELKKNDEISLTFAPDDEDEALKSLIFKTKVTSLEDIDKAETKYDHAKVKEVNVLKDVNEELHVDEIYGSLYHTKQGKGILDKQGTKEITGKTKFANAVVKVYSELGEAQLFPDIQVDENGKFSFDAEKAGFRLQNGETLNFAVVKPITGDLLHQGFVSKYIDVYESPEEKKEREFEEKLENTPAYHKLGEKKVERKAPKLEK